MSCKFLFGRRNANILRRALDMQRALGKPCVKYCFAWGNLSPTFVEEENNSQYSLMTVDGMNGFYLHGSCQVFWEFLKITGSTNHAQTKSVFNMAPQASRVEAASYRHEHLFTNYRVSKVAAPQPPVPFPRLRQKGPVFSSFPVVCIPGNTPCMCHTPHQQNG